jgi:hypothetical protein
MYLWFKVAEFKCMTRLNDSKIYRAQAGRGLLAGRKALSSLSVLLDVKNNPRG